MALRSFLLDGVMDLLNGLKDRYELHIVTNGVAETQYKRLAAAGLDKLFQGIYVSEESGYQKPQQEYFDYCFEKMGRRKQCRNRYSVVQSAPPGEHGRGACGLRGGYAGKDR